MNNLLEVTLRLFIAGLILYVSIKISSRVFSFATTKYRNASSKQKKIFFIGLAVLFLALPFVASSNDYVLRTFTMMLLYTMLALSLNFVVGFAGQLSMGHSAFYGVGAYTTALLMVNFKVPFLVAMICSALMAALFGFFLGMPTLRLKGDYLAITTIGFAEIVRLVLINWDKVTRGPAGIPGIPSPSFFGFTIQNNIGYYFLILILAGFTGYITWRLYNSRLGRGLIAVRDDEIAAEAMGIKPVRLKVLAFVLGAALAGVAGSYFATYIHYVNPDNFNYSESVFILCMVVLGGIGSLPGVVVGSGILTALPELLRDAATYRYAIYGLLLIIMMIVRPQGMISEVSLKGGDVDGTAASKWSFKNLWRPYSRK